MELGQVRRIHRLVPEHPINTEELRWPEPVVALFLCLRRAPVRGCCIRRLILVFTAALRGELVEHRRGGGGRVRSEK